MLAIFDWLFIFVNSSATGVYTVPGLIHLPDKSLRVEYIELPADYDQTDDGTGKAVCPDGYTFPKPSSYLEMMVLKANMPGANISQQQFYLGTTAVMSQDGSHLLSVDSNTGRIIPRTFWEADMHTKILEEEIISEYDQIILDLESPESQFLIDKSPDSIEGKVLTGIFRKPEINLGGRS